jgi:uncharacterized membrane protein
MTEKDFEHENYSSWKLGIFYFNRNDKRSFVHKRIRILGWTLNFAHPLSYVVLALIFILAYILSNLP